MTELAIPADREGDVSGRIPGGQKRSRHCNVRIFRMLRQRLPSAPDINAKKLRNSLNYFEKAIPSFFCGLFFEFQEGIIVAMGSFVTGLAVSFALGFVYFLGAIPGGVAAGVNVPLAALAAWAGYSAGAGVVVLAGAPARDWLVRRFRIPVGRDPSKWIWRVWDRWGLIGLGLLAPVTIGPQIGGLLALAAGGRPGRIWLGLSAGVVPWCVLFGSLVAAGVRLTR